MTPEDVRKLLGGYATGSLSEAERKALFQAALEDQDLFDELAGEQALKEVLDEPGARQRLITVLEPPRRHRIWLWAAATATLSIAVVTGIVVSQRTPPLQQQIAQVRKSAEPPVPAPTAPPPKATPRKVAPAAATAPGPPPPPPAELKKEEAEADRLQEVKPQAAAEALRGFVAGAAPQVAAGRADAGRAATRQAENAIVSALNAFAFNYAVRPDGFLQIVPMARGFLSVTAGDTVVFPSGAVTAGTPVRIPIPTDAASLVISFSETPGITGSPVRRDEPSGTVTDQDPPNGRIIIQLFLTPATR